jgi:hypothetical protein
MDIAEYIRKVLKIDKVRLFPYAPIDPRDSQRRDVGEIMPCTRMVPTPKYYGETKMVTTAGVEIPDKPVWMAVEMIYYYSDSMNPNYMGVSTGGTKQKLWYLVADDGWAPLTLRRMTPPLHEWEAIEYVSSHNMLTVHDLQLVRDAFNRME